LGEKKEGDCYLVGTVCSDSLKGKNGTKSHCAHVWAAGIIPTFPGQRHGQLTWELAKVTGVSTFEKAPDLIPNQIAL
jgi:hypothetical protein